MTPPQTADYAGHYPLTLSGGTVLEVGVKPFKVRVDWLCQEAYGDKVVVELHVMDEEPKVLRRFDNPPEAAGWARKWLEDRGFEWTCDIDTAQRHDWKHITLFPRPPHNDGSGA